MTIRHLDQLFGAERVLLLGAPQGPAALRLCENIEGCIRRERRALVGGQRKGWNSVAIDADWPRAEVAIALDPLLIEAPLFARLAAIGCRALVVTTPSERILALRKTAREHGVRILGSRSSGIAVPGKTVGAGLDLSLLPLTPLAGPVALIAQSRSVAAAALDWANGLHLGFSWIADTGGEADIDIADLLDYASFDPATQAVVLQVGRIRTGRKFMSAARACARTKPVVVLQTRPALDEGPAGPDALRSAAFRRAGLVECESLAGLFDALAALERLPKLSGNRVLVVGNGAGICALGVDAMLRAGLGAAELPTETRAAIAAALPSARFAPGAIDVSFADADATLAALWALHDCRSFDALLCLRGPVAGESHEEVAAKLVKARPGPRLLTVWLGLETALPARELCAEAKIPTFTSPDAAARALRYRWEYHRTQEALSQTPASAGAAPAAGVALRTELAARAARGERSLDEAATAALLAAYGLPVVAATSHIEPARIALETHAEFGLALRIEPLASGVGTRSAYALPPLDDLLARRALLESGFHPGPDTASAFEALAAALIHLASLAIDQPQLAGLQLELGAPAYGPAWARAVQPASLHLRPPQERERLALAPYPAALGHQARLRDGATLAVRPIRPTDEPALLDLLGRMRPEDIRLRFFATIRRFTHAMAARMAQIDYDRELTLIAAPVAQPEALIAIATLIADPDRARAEFAVLIHHDYAGRGVGRHLVAQLLTQARRGGIGVVHGEVLRENDGMRGLARALGFSERIDPDDPGCVIVEIATGDADGGGNGDSARIAAQTPSPV